MKYCCLERGGTPYNDPYGETQKGYLFQASGVMKGFGLKLKHMEG